MQEMDLMQLALLVLSIAAIFGIIIFDRLGARGESRYELMKEEQEISYGRKSTSREEVGRTIDQRLVLKEFVLSSYLPLTSSKSGVIFYFMWNVTIPTIALVV